MTEQIPVGPHIVLVQVEGWKGVIGAGGGVGPVGVGVEIGQLLILLQQFGLVGLH